MRIENQDMSRATPEIMPLKRAVVEITHEADFDDDQAIRKAVRAWHNRLAQGTVPRSIIRKVGRGLFLDISAFREWLDEQAQDRRPRRGRPRNKD
jgi:hypothetical protein